MARRQACYFLGYKREDIRHEYMGISINGLLSCKAADQQARNCDAAAFGLISFASDNRIYLSLSNMIANQSSIRHRTIGDCFTK